LTFFDLTRPSHPHHSRSFLDVYHQPGGFLEKARHVTEKGPFDGLSRERLQVMKMVFNGLDDSTVNFLNVLFLNRIKGH
jgi:hypothetical protein